jgi:hypothetical protein
MKTRSFTLLFAFAAVLAAATLPASAVSFDFYKLGRGAGDFVPNGVAGTDYFPILGDNVSSNVSGGTFNGNLKFTNGGITATATGTFNNAVVAVVQDSEPGWNATTGAGLGVYHVNPLDTSDDNITAGEKLTLTFSQTVQITSIALRSDGHNFTNWSVGDTFLLNGVSTLLPLNVGSIPVNLTGTQFTFAFGGTQANQFYLASLEARSVPDGGATVALMGLSTIALGVFRARFAKQ